MRMWVWECGGAFVVILVVIFVDPARGVGVGVGGDLRARACPQEEWERLRARTCPQEECKSFASMLPAGFTLFPQAGLCLRGL